MSLLALLVFLIVIGTAFELSRANELRVNQCVIAMAAMTFFDDEHKSWQN